MEQEPSGSPTLNRPLPPLGLPLKGRGFTPQQAQFWQEKARGLRDLSPGEAPEFYTVISGDTLWEIAEHMMGDPYWWPKLWILNPQVKNPHWIVPGTVVHFYSRGNLNSQGVGQDGDQEDAPPPTTQPVLLAKGKMAHMGDPLQDDPWAKGTLVLDEKELGASQVIEVQGEFKGIGGEVLTLPGFFTQHSPEPIGTVLEVRTNPLAPPHGALMYAHFEKPPSGGQKVLLARKGFQPTSPLMESLQSEFWTIVAECGVVDTKNSITTLMILGIFHSVEREDVFLPHQKIYFPYTPGSASGPAQSGKGTATVIGVGGGTQGSAGKGMSVFLSQPSSPLSAGELLPIFIPPGGGIAFEERALPARQVGKIQVVHGAPEWALAVVVEASQEISIGAQTSPHFQRGIFAWE